MMMRLRALSFATLALPLLASGSAFGSQEPDEDEKPVPPSDAHARPGAPVVYATEPPTGTQACSFRTPVCVHYTKMTAAVPVVLASAERAWETLRGTMGVPPPEGATYDVYLAPTEGVAATRLSARDVRSRIDRARSFVVVDPAARPGCALESAVTRAIAEAFEMGHAPAMDEATRRSQASYLATLIVPCAIAFDADAGPYQSRPDRCAADDGDASLFWSRIDWAWSRTPGGLVTATWALSPSMTESTTTWRDEPDVFDVLRVTFKNALHSGSTFEDLLLDTAIARAFMGDADDGSHQPETRTLGASARVPLDWDIAWPDQPRRLAPRRPVEPTGSSYVSIKAKPGARLRAEIAWEEHALFRWAFVKVDANGKEIGRVVIPSRERATEAAMTLVELGGADRVLLVGVNVGDPSYRFDPDDETWEPHGWLVTLAGVAD